MATKQQTAKALEGSIEKWRKIVVREGQDYSGSNCPLCALFPDWGCPGCPVMKASGKSECRGTPFANWRKHQNKKHACGGVNECPTCTRLARKELKFLESLRTE